MAETTQIPPYGGMLVERLLPPGAAHEALSSEAARLRPLVIGARAQCDLELLAVGGFSPLAGFMGSADYARVLKDMRLADGTVWPIPVVLPVAKDVVKAGERIALLDARNDLLAVMDVREVFERDPEAEAMALLGRCDAAHPYTAEILAGPRFCAAGPVEVLRLPAHHDFAALRLTPRETRERLLALGGGPVVAFQTRNPLHRSHEELTRRAARDCGGLLLIHPVVGMTRPGDVDHYTRVRTYKALVENHYDAERTLLALLPLAMRMAGPREAVWHAILRRNYGATHFIVGRDHAGPAPDSQGKPFFRPDQAQELAKAHAKEIGVEILTYAEVVYLEDEDRYELSDRLPQGAKVASISGTQVRRDFLEKGKLLPAWFTRPEVAKILAQTHPPRHEQGVCVWFTGLSGAGKSTTAEALLPYLLERGRHVTLLDGDIVRQHLSKGLGFSREDRDANVTRIGFVAAEIVRHGGVAVCAAVSPYRAARAQCREMVGADRFVEVFMDTPIEVCESRDTKGLYAKARAGTLPGFTGISDPYEAPEKPELVLPTVGPTPAENARRIVDVLIERGFLQE
ncbi:MAG: bifunctional sulfate adenylyltransferase/adenylylsulfate kinase [Vicinamibacteria bacterium]|nr:bifunctional sulfate adenylyltransferase/adenylylsulfate kinase [Vicinamibacteria bacterium]